MLIRFWLFSNYNRFSNFLRLTYFKHKTIAISNKGITFAYRIKTNNSTNNFNTYNYDNNSKQHNRER